MFSRGEEGGGSSYSVVNLYSVAVNLYSVVNIIILCIKLLLLLRSGLRVVFVSAIPSLDFLDYSGGHPATHRVPVQPVSWSPGLQWWSSGDTSCSDPTRLSVLPWTTVVVIWRHIVSESNPFLGPPLDCNGGHPATHRVQPVTRSPGLQCRGDHHLATPSPHLTCCVPFGVF